MKIKILLLTLSSFLIVQLTAQKSWLKHRAKSVTQQKIALEKEQSFLRTNAPSASHRSTQEGEVWNKLASDAIPLGQEVNSLKMVDENTVWMTSSTYLFGPPSEGNANVHQSLDGGETWTTLFIPDTEGFFAVDIAPIDANIAYVTLWGNNFQNDLSKDAVYKTTDGGISWEKLESYPHSPSYVHFFNELDGWVFGGDRANNEFGFTIMSVTADGGQTWNHAGGNDWVIPEGRALPPQDENEFVGTFTFAVGSNYDVSDSTIIIGGTGYWISHDKGYTWEKRTSPLFEEDELVHGVIAMKDTLTYIFASNLDPAFFFGEATAYITTDGGQTWTKSISSINPSAAAYLPGTENDFMITGQDQGFDPSFGFGLTGTIRTSNLENWETVDDKGLLSLDFIGENQGIGAFANYPGTVEAGNVYSWGEKVQLEYDAVVTSNNDYPFTIITLNHLSEDIVYDYQIQNLGLNDLSNTTLTMEVVLNGEIIATESEEVEIGQDLAQSVALIYRPTQVGLHEFNITASQPNLGEAFFTETRFLEVSETTLAKDDGIGELAFSIGADSVEWTHGYLGTEYNLLVDDQLTAFSIVVGEGGSDSTGLYNFIVKAIDDNGMPEEGTTYKSAPLPIIDAFNNFSHITIQLPEPVALPAGRYIFAVGQDEPQAAVNFGFDNKPDLGMWFYSPVGFGGSSFPWTNVDDGSFPTLMLRPIFGTPMSTSTQEALLAETTPLSVFPVPFKEELNILLDYTEEPTVTIQIFDMAGKQWQNFTTSHQQLINKNLSELPNGLYLLKLQSGLYQRSVKVLKQ